MVEAIDLSGIPNEAIRKQIQQSLNLLEKLWTQLRALQEENQLLRDEISHLKGELFFASENGLFRNFREIV